MWAYARNPTLTGTGYPDINFCPEFFDLKNLDNAIAYGSGVNKVKWKNDLENYVSRGRLDPRCYLSLKQIAN
jgi:hypothetical protein